MQTIDIQTTVGELVKERPARSRIFEKFKIDYCCGGKIPLTEACEKRGVDPETVLDALIADESAQDGYVDADAMSLTDLADHIVVTHHDHLREELPRLDFMTRKVAAVHGDVEPRLQQIRDVFVAFQDELTHHMEKEEQILFPMIRTIDKADSAPEFHCGSLANPIRVMESEHDNAGNAMEQFRKVERRRKPLLSVSPVTHTSCHWRTTRTRRQQIQTTIILKSCEKTNPRTNR